MHVRTHICNTTCMKNTQQISGWWKTISTSSHYQSGLLTNTHTATQAVPYYTTFIKVRLCYKKHVCVSCGWWDILTAWVSWPIELFKVIITDERTRGWKEERKREGEEKNKNIITAPCLSWLKYQLPAVGTWCASFPESIAESGKEGVR